LRQIGGDAGAIVSTRLRRLRTGMACSASGGVQRAAAARHAVSRLSDDDIDELFDLARTDGIMPIVRKTVRFNRHRDLIQALFRHAPARKLLFRSFAL
jgi:hypothetical protein